MINMISPSKVLGHYFLENLPTNDHTRSFKVGMERELVKIVCTVHVHDIVL